MNYISGKKLRELREKKNYTQKQLGEQLGVSEKTISKWETEKGLPDITLIEPLARELQISVVELLKGEYNENRNKAANMKRSHFYVCPLCGNVIYALGEGSYSCCGILLPQLISEKINEAHEIYVERVDNEYCISLSHPMEKEHYISFIAYVTSDRMQMVKLYPEQGMESRFRICGHGIIYAYCNKHGLFEMKL